MSNLFTPLTVGSITFRNRVAMPPMVRFTPPMPAEVTDSGGHVTGPVLDYYRRRAAAGTALVIVEATAVDPAGRPWAQGLCAYDDAHTAELATLAEAIRGEGAVAAIQLVHGGPQASSKVSGLPIVGPSAQPVADGAPVPQGLTVEEILAIEERFAAAADRAVQAGFQAVEVHGAHGYLLDSFLFTERNRRTDEYGGTLAGRMRMLVETCRRVRTQLAGRALLGCRISAFNKVKEGFSAADLAELVQGVSATGIDLLHLSTNGALRPVFRKGKSTGQLARASTRAPLIVAGNLGDPQDAERLVGEGHADFAAVGVAMIKDADWTLHAREALEGQA